jgi:hypothetical protein
LDSCFDFAFIHTNIFRENVNCCYSAHLNNLATKYVRTAHFHCILLMHLVCLEPANSTLMFCATHAICYLHFFYAAWCEASLHHSKQSEQKVCRNFA